MWSILRFFRAVGYTLIGNVSYWSANWESSPAFINAEYDDIEAKSSKDVDQTIEAVSQLQTIVLEKEDRLGTLSKEVADLRRKLDGTKAKAGARTKELQAQGKTAEQIKTDDTVIKCLEWYENFKSTLAAKEEEANAIEKDLNRLHSQQAQYERRLQKMVADHKSLKEERNATIADVQMAKQQEKLDNALLGLKQSGAAERRKQMQDMRKGIRAKADTKSRVAGVVQEDVEAEFLEFATKSEASSEFFDQIGLDDKKETSSASGDIKLPE